MLAGWSLFNWALIEDYLLLAFERLYCLKFIRIRDKVAVVITVIFNYLSQGLLKLPPMWPFFFHYCQVTVKPNPQTRSSLKITTQFT